jgi:uncharacterized protein YwgA
MPLTRRNWLLVFIGLPEGSFRADQLRITKGMFVFAKSCGDSSLEMYTFEPYDYGPFSRELYRDLDVLDREGFIRRNEVAGSNRQIFELTSKGEQAVRHLIAEAPAKEKDALAAIKKRVTSLNFTQLLTWIYGEYPESAVYSKARV